MVALASMLVGVCHDGGDDPVAVIALSVAVHEMEQFFGEENVLRVTAQTVKACARQQAEHTSRN
jgi:hypothetical protein